MYTFRIFMKSPNESIANEIQPFLNARVESTLKIQDFKGLNAQVPPLVLMGSDS